MRRKSKLSFFVRLIPVFLFCTFILVLSIFNLPPVLHYLRECVSMEKVSFKGVDDKILKYYKSDDFWGKDQFININGLFSRAELRNTLNGTVKMKNGMLHQNVEQMDMSYQAQQTIDLAKFTERCEIPFLYVMAPCKVSLNKEYVTPYTDDFLNENTDQFLDLLRSDNVTTLDLRHYVAETGQMIDEYFYRTDHHWTPEGAFIGFQTIVDQMEDLLQEQFHKAWTNREYWDRNVVKKCFLGSNGRRVGKYFGGVDDLIYLTPKEDLSGMEGISGMHSFIPDSMIYHDGNYESVCLEEKYIFQKNYFHLDNYSVYFNGNHPHMCLKNSKALNHKKILMIGDSYSLPVYSFMQMLFSEIDTIDPRSYNETTIAEYIELNRPDMVIMMLYPGLLGTKTAFDFGDCTEDKKMEVRECFSEEKLPVSLSGGKSDYFVLPVKMTGGRYYSLQVESAKTLNASADRVMVCLYDKTNYKSIINRLWNLGEEPFAWSFVCPMHELLDAFEIRISWVGEEETEGHNFELHDVKMFEKYSNDGLRGIYSVTNTEILASTSAWESFTFYPALERGGRYLLSLNGLRFSGEGDRIMLVLFDETNGSTIFTKELEIVRDNKDYNWSFMIPPWIQAEDSFGIRIYDGLPGETVDNELKIDHIFLDEMFSCFGEELVSYPTMELKPASYDWNYYTIDADFLPGETYTIYAREIDPTAGNTDVVTVALFDSLRKETISFANWTIWRKEYDGYHWTFTVPSDEEQVSNLQLLLYAGRMGNTKNQGVIYHGVSLHHWPDIGSDSVIYTRDAANIASSNSKYNCFNMPLDLRPGHAYHITIQEQSIVGGSSNRITVKLRSEHLEKDIDEKEWWINGKPYPFDWIFTIPDEFVGATDAVLQVYAGACGETEWREANFSHIVVREID